VSDPAREAFERAVGAIGRRERTVAELRGWLMKRGFEAQAIESAISRLIELGELDDERFARRYAEDKRELSGWGNERIREALREREVDPLLIEAALAVAPHEEEVARASALLEARGDSLDGEAARARALAYLSRRGYELEVAYDAVRRREREAAAPRVRQ
jgi:regulatory protein